MLFQVDHCLVTYSDMYIEKKHIFPEALSQCIDQHFANNYQNFHWFINSEKKKIASSNLMILFVQSNGKSPEW
jgi:hypothetical protein